MRLKIKDTFNSELPADPIIANTRRQVKNSCFSFAVPRQTTKPELVHVSKEMAASLGLREEDINSSEFLKVFTGNEVLPNTKPYAMCYGGHQFGNWAGQLGDGRAINLAEVVNGTDRWALQLKGAGETPYSRTADGLAVLRSSIREYLCSEAMFHLGVPTTRALSLALTGDDVLRDMLYDGNSGYEKGAVVCRVSPSFLRFGSYEIFTARGDKETLKTLVDYSIKNFFPHLGEPSQASYVKFFKEVADRTLEMVIHWQRVGFVHGVMNTDNMSILGLTIDYGPYGWLEGYDEGWTPNTTDGQYKRYRYGNQLQVALWNLIQLAKALLPLLEDAKQIEAILGEYIEDQKTGYLEMMRSKIGLYTAENQDNLLIQDLEEVLQLTETDMTIFFRNLSNVTKNDLVFEKDSRKFLNPIMDAFYKPNEVENAILEQWRAWFIRYSSRLQTETVSDEERKAKMNTVNPKYVLRNYMAQLAIDAVDNGDHTVLNELFDLLKFPYDEQTQFQKWFAKRPEWARHKVGCSMLSCSS